MAVPSHIVYLDAFDDFERLKSTIDDESRKRGDAALKQLTIKFHEGVVVYLKRKNKGFVVQAYKNTNFVYCRDAGSDRAYEHFCDYCAKEAYGVNVSCVFIEFFIRRA